VEQVRANVCRGNPKTASPRDAVKRRRWRLDEVFVKINGEQYCLWRAVDLEGEVLESFVTKRRNKKAALRFLKKTLTRHGRAEQMVTDRLRSCSAALKELGIGDRQETGHWGNNRAKNSHQPFRRLERAMLRFRRMRTLQKFASVHNHFNQELSHYSRPDFKANRPAALAEWRQLFAACAKAGLGNQRRVRICLTAPAPGIPDCPLHLSDLAADEWHRIAAVLHEAGILTLVDRAALAACCQACGRWVEAEEKLRDTPTLIRTPSGYIQQSP
jgi:putative transposase